LCHQVLADEDLISHWPMASTAVIGIVNALTLWFVARELRRSSRPMRPPDSDRPGLVGCYQDRSVRRARPFAPAPLAFQKRKNHGAPGSRSQSQTPSENSFRADSTLPNAMISCQSPSHGIAVCTLYLPRQRDLAQHLAICGRHPYRPGRCSFGHPRLTPSPQKTRHEFVFRALAREPDPPTRAQSTARIDLHGPFSQALFFPSANDKPKEPMAPTVPASGVREQTKLTSPSPLPGKTRSGPSGSRGLEDLHGPLRSANASFPSPG